MTRRRALAAAILLAACAAPSCGSDDGAGGAIRLGATHTLRDTGLLDVLVPAFERETGVRVTAVVGGTGEVLKKAERGDFDVVIVHSREAEDEFVAKGLGVERRDVWWNRFLIVGPDPMGRQYGILNYRLQGRADEPTDLSFRDPDAAEAMRQCREAGQTWVSRGDDSGTHKRELELWGDDFRKWRNYLETGQGMSATLTIASEKRGSTLTDEGTWFRLRRRLGMQVVVRGDPKLANPYGAILVKDRPASARRLLDWLAGERCRALVKAFTVDGERAFFLPGEPPPSGADADPNADTGRK
jgi:tungstate transport system substrate-binding protein